MGLRNSQEKHMESLPKISEYMDTAVPTLSPETHIIKAVDFLLHHHVTGAPVVDSDGRLVGIITETDLLKTSPTVGLKYKFKDNRYGVITNKRVLEILDRAKDLKEKWFYHFLLIALYTGMRRAEIFGAITRYDLLRVVRKLSAMP